MFFAEQIKQDLPEHGLEQFSFAEASTGPSIAGFSSCFLCSKE